MRRWDAYEAFVAVVESGSFTAAAEKLRISKSAVSRLVSALEDRLGSELLFRTTRQLGTTDLGRMLYRRCVEAFENLEAIDLDAMDHDAVPRGRLRITASDTFGERWIAPLVAELTSRYDALEVELLITDRVVDIVGEGFDLAIRYNSQVDSSLRAQKLFELPHICAASPVYLNRAGKPVVPEDLTQHNCLISTLEPCSHWKFHAGSQDKQYSLKGTWVSSSGPVLIAAALQGIGIVWLPEVYLREHVNAGRLVELLSEYQANPMDVWCVYPARRQTSAKVRLFIDYLRHGLPELHPEARTKRWGSWTI